MDPDEALRNIRSLIKQATHHSDIAALLMEQFEALDEWLSKGGALPEDWEDNSWLER